MGKARCVELSRRTSYVRRFLHMAAAHLFRFALILEVAQFDQAAAIGTVEHVCFSRLSVGRKEAGGLFGIIPAPVVKLRRRWIAVPCRLLHVLQLRTVLKRGGDEGCAH
jgi:hypothetical protein